MPSCRIRFEGEGLIQVGRLVVRFRGDSGEADLDGVAGRRVNQKQRVDDWTGVSWRPLIDGRRVRRLSPRSQVPNTCCGHVASLSIMINTSVAIDIMGLQVIHHVKGDQEYRFQAWP